MAPLPQSTTQIQLPAPYDRVRKGLAIPFKRIYAASHVWPWDWLPKTYRPIPQNWGENAAVALAQTVEVACEPGSGVTMTELRDFLVNREAEHQRGSGDRPNRLRSDCFKAQDWIKSKKVQSSPTQDTSRHNASIRQARAEARTRGKVKAALECGTADSSDEQRCSDEESECEPENNIPPPQPAGSELSHFSNSLGERNPAETSLPAENAQTYSSTAPMTDVSETDAQSEVMDSSGPMDCDTNPAEMNSAMPATEGGGIGQNEDVNRAAFKQIVQATNDCLSNFETSKQHCIVEIQDQKSRLHSKEIYEAQLRLQAAKEERDKAEKDCSRKSFLFASTQAMINSLGDKRTDTDLAEHADVVHQRDKAVATKCHAQTSFDRLEAEVRRLMEVREQALEPLTDLEAKLGQLEKIIEIQKKKKKLLASIGNN
ncbi:hypothetical protein ACHAPU_011440 [Fusarium lateritium]